MSNISKPNASKNKRSRKGSEGNSAPRLPQSNAYLWSMSHAPSPESDGYTLQLLPAVFFTAFLILLVRMVDYTRPMKQFFWSNGVNDLSDFFSYFKMICLLICAGVVLIMLLFRLCTQSLAVKRSFAYIPMVIYSAMVLLSFVFSDYKEFALLGYNDRFEGTLSLLAYMVVLFFVINTVNGERSVKWITYGLVISTTLLSLLGISQALNHDFFQTAIGQKILVPNYLTESGLSTWQMIDALAEEGEQFLNFTFTHQEIYQTVYNINYVSFYLTLLIPLFGMLFIRSVNRGADEPLWKKMGWGVLFALVVFNLIGSASSGGFLGLAAVGILGILLLNKRLVQWWKPVAILLVITLAVGGITFNRWLPELTNATKSVLNVQDKEEGKGEGNDDGENDGASGAADGDTVNGYLTRGYIDYIVTGDNTIDFSINGDLLTVTLEGEGDQFDGFTLKDAQGAPIAMHPSTVEKGVYTIGDERFSEYATIAYSQNKGTYYIVIGTNGKDWYFPISEDGIYYLNDMGNWVKLHQVPHIGFANNQGFGSGRGYIWSRSLPMMKDTLLLGHGADTYCLYFPHEDYVGKYNSGVFSYNINIVVDKPHNMFMAAAINTGGISVLALLALWGIYLVQSIRLYRKRSYDSNDFLTFAGVGIALGIFGFLVSGLVNDSTVSVMPMFYGLLGTGIAINALLSRKVETEYK